MLMMILGSKYRMKHRLSVYLDPRLLTQLNDLANQKNQSKSLVAEAAIASFLSPNEIEQREAALMRRLDRLTRQGERLHRDLTISVEALAMFIHYWLTLIPTLPRTPSEPRRPRVANVLPFLSKRWGGGSRAGRTFCATSL